MKYVKKPVVIDAIEWRGELTDEIRGFFDSPRRYAYSKGKPLGIRTLEGLMECPVGWMIIKGVAGEYYSCEPRIFILTYENIADE